MTSPTDTTVRQATEADIPAILCLLLTSFRQFPLFSALYSPIEAKSDNARDTLFFWRRRLLLDFLKPGCTVLVAELPASESPRSDDELQDGDAEKSKRMFRWLVETANLSQVVDATGRRVVGFAIWRIRGLGSEGGEETMGWGSWLRKKQIDLQLAFYHKFYTRRDQDPVKYDAYRKAEDEMGERFYKEPCYQLDNLAVDFRFQRQGIGALLVQEGLEKAHELGLDAGTEAGPMGEGLYKKMGFKLVGTWTIPLPGMQDMELPVLRYSAVPTAPS